MAFEMDMLRAGQSPDLSDRSLLVVEDEYFIAELVVDALSATGAGIVGPADSLEQAFSLLGGHDADGAVLNVDLHGTPVFPLAEALRERERPFLFISAYDDISRLDARFADVPLLGKPIRIAALQTAVAGILGASPAS